MVHYFIPRLHYRINFIEAVKILFSDILLQIIDMDLPGVSGIIPTNNKWKYLNGDTNNTSEDSNYSINLDSGDDSGNSSERNLFGSETEDYNDDTVIQNACSQMKINMNNPPPAPQRFSFSGDPKVQVNISEVRRPLQFFSLFLDLLDWIINETNRFASQHGNVRKHKSCIDRNVGEIMLFFSFYFCKV